MYTQIIFLQTDVVFEPLRLSKQNIYKTIQY